MPEERAFPLAKLLPAIVLGFLALEIYFFLSGPSAAVDPVTGQSLIKQR